MKSSPSQQPSLFDSPALKLGALGRAIKLALNRAARESSLSREELAHRAAALAEEAGIHLCPGGRLGIGTLDKWLNVDSAGSVPSLLGFAVLCRILGNAGAVAPLLEYLGLEVMDTEGRRHRDVGRAYLELKEAKKGLRKAEAEL